MILLKSPNSTPWKTIGVKAEERTYGFDLAAAFPAILLSLDFLTLPEFLMLSFKC